MGAALLSPKADTILKAITRSVEYCSKGLLPINPIAYDRLIIRFCDGTYERDRELLVSDIKSDLGLFVALLASANSLPKSALPRTAGNRGILSRLAAVPLPQLESVFRQSNHLVAKGGDLLSLSELHLAIITASISTASVAEILAERRELDSELAFACSSLRQMGRTLLAFNYPSVFSRAMKEVGEFGSGFESTLTKLLGYSPQDFTNNLSSAWGLGIEIQSVVSGSLSGNSNLSATDKDALLLISECCDIAEAYTAAKTGFQFLPPPREKKARVSEVLAVTLGGNSAEEILKRIRLRSTNYLEILPNLLHCIDPRDLSSTNTPKIKENTFLTCVAEETASLLSEVYENIIPNKPSPKALSELSLRIVPALGFKSGCIFLINQQTRVLEPKLRIGSGLADRYRPVSLSAGGGLATALVGGLSRHAPVIEEEVFLHGDRTSHISWRLSDVKDIGLLHLEPRFKSSFSSQRELFLVFLAVRKAFQDALGLGAVWLFIYVV